MRKKSIAAFLMALICGIAEICAAHPPSGLEIDHDRESGKINVYVAHATTNVSRHYVSSVILVIDGNTVDEKNFADQTENSGTSVEFYVPEGNDGGVIEVTAFCSVSGKRTMTLEL